MTFLRVRGNQMKQKFTEVDFDQEVNNINEIIIAVSPSFGTQQTMTLAGIPTEIVLKEIAAGIEEEGMEYRIIKFYHTANLAFIASAGSKLSGSGISIGLQSKGTMMIHQRNLEPLDNLELFPQAPLYNERIFRSVGKNTAKYAKGETPPPVETLNDQMALSKYQVKAALLQIMESQLIDPNKHPVELIVTEQSEKGMNLHANS